MRAMMGLIKDRHGTYYAQRRVPDRLQEAVARVLNSEKPKQVFLKKSLGTKAVKAANVAATHVLADFDRTLASAEALLKARPSVSSLTEAQSWVRFGCVCHSVEGGFPKAVLGIPHGSVGPSGANREP